MPSMPSFLSHPSLETAIDAALSIPARSISDAVARLKQEYPGADPEELVGYAADRFRKESSVSSAAIGVFAGVPAVTTPIAAVLTAGQMAVFLKSAVTYILTVAQLRGLNVVNPDKRRVLVLAALLGRDSSEIIEQSLGMTTLYWATQSLADMPASSARSMNAVMRKLVLKRLGSRATAVAAGRLIPLGIGAVVGGVGGYRLANQVIENADGALAPAAVEYPEVTVV